MKQCCIKSVSLFCGKKSILMRGKYKDRIYAWLLLLLFSGAIASSVWHDVHLWKSYPQVLASTQNSRPTTEFSSLHFQAHHCVWCDFHAVAYDIPNGIQADLGRSLAEINTLTSRPPVFLATQRVSLLPARAPPFLL
jgi:hypothetical protein